MTVQTLASGARPLAAGAAERLAASKPVVATLTGRAAFDALEGEWLALEEGAENPAVFQSYAWCRAVWDHHTRTGTRFEPVILTARAQGRLVGILPLKRVRTRLAAVLTGLGEPFQQYTDVLVAPGAGVEVAEELVRAACGLKRCGGLSFLKVRDDSLLATVLGARGAARGNIDAAPYVDLRPFPVFDDYLKTINAKTRKNMRNARNRLARESVLGHRVLTDPAEIDALVARAHAGRERWLEELGLTSRAFRDPGFGDFTRAVAAPESGLSVLAMSLTLDGRPIADQWGFVLNGRYYAYVATWDPAMVDSSPGKLHLQEVIQSCHERGLAVADFLMPAARYKLTWTDTVVPVADYALPLSAGAWIEGTLWSAHLRPILKRLALKLPPELRSRIARLLLKR